LRRTDRRIRELKVEQTADGLVVRGHTSSYYLKQLALHAVLESMDSTDSIPVQVEIEVIRPGWPGPTAVVPESARRSSGA
jgi:hypothetical protein